MSFWWKVIGEEHLENTSCKSKSKLSDFVDRKFYWKKANLNFRFIETCVPFFTCTFLMFQCEMTIFLSFDSGDSALFIGDLHFWNLLFLSIFYFFSKNVLIVLRKQRKFYKFLSNFIWFSKKRSKQYYCSGSVNRGIHRYNYLVFSMQVINLKPSHR